MTPQRYAIWPCGTCCYEEELEEYLRFMSDDYRITDIAPEWI